MKKSTFAIALLLLFCIFQSNLNAQQNPSDSPKKLVNDEFSLTVGIGSSAGLFDYFEYTPLLQSSYPWFLISETPEVTAKKSPAINLSYTININQFFALTATASYTHMRLYYQSLNSSPYSGIKRINFFSIFIGPRVSWYNTKTIKLYSSASFGYGFGSAIDWTKSQGNKDMTYPLFDFQISPIGAIFFNRYNVELGYGGTGFLKFGFIFK